MLQGRQEFQYVYRHTVSKKKILPQSKEQLNLKSEAHLSSIHFDCADVSSNINSLHIKLKLRAVFFSLLPKCTEHASLTSIQSIKWVFCIQSCARDIFPNLSQ